MRTIAPLCSGLALLVWCTVPTAALAAPKRKSHATVAKKPEPKADAPKDGDDPLQKQLEWEAKVLGPSSEKKIDHAKIQRLQAEELARREKQEKLEKERKEREAALAAQRKDVAAPSTREVPTIEETATAPVPAKPVEKHDDAFVDKLLKNDRPLPKKKVSAGPDEVDDLLKHAKEEKKSVRKSRSDGVDELLATADKQAPIVTSAPKAEAPEPVSAEAAAREAALKAIAAAKAQEELQRGRSKKPVIPDAAVLRAQAQAQPAARPSMILAAPEKSDWTDPFDADASKSTASARNRRAGGERGAPMLNNRPAAGRRPPAAHPPTEGGGWHDPSENNGGAKRPAAKPTKPAGKSRQGWKDPFA